MNRWTDNTICAFADDIEYLILSTYEQTMSLWNMVIKNNGPTLNRTFLGAGGAAGAGTPFFDFETGCWAESGITEGECRWKGQGQRTTKDGHYYNSCTLENNRTPVLVQNYPTLKIACFLGNLIMGTSNFSGPSLCWSMATMKILLLLYLWYHFSCISLFVAYW